MAKYFKESEFKKCTPPCGIEDMDRRFLDKLDEIRERAGIPMVINSAYRSRAWDLSQGRSTNSAHQKGLAVDIRCNTSQNRLKIIRAALESGVTRIGIGGTYIHLDADESLPQNVIWHYYK